MCPPVNRDVRVLEIRSLFVSSTLYESKLLVFEMAAIDTWILKRTPHEFTDSWIVQEGIERLHPLCLLGMIWDQIGLLCSW